MLDSPDEYKRMHEAESRLWWYKALHCFVLKSIETQFKTKNISIVDAGCGTGGLIKFLNRNSYLNVSGFDLSPYALSYCKENSLNVFEGTITSISHYFQKSSIDVIICNDNLYFLSEEERLNAISSMKALLKTNGILILNLPALNGFAGTHDVAVGIKNRFSKKRLNEFLNLKELEVVELKYWPFILSPVIYILRTWQRLKIRLFEVKNAASDVEVPNKLLNTIFYKITLFENRLKITKPWGSSLFVVLRKNQH